jgi:outer membrane protein TolC
MTPMKKQIFFLVMITAVVVRAQENPLSLQQCYQLALKNHPLSAQNQLFEHSSQVQNEIYDNTNLPQLNFNGQATFQSAVTELPFSIPGMSPPDIPRDQYKLSLDASQVIYGGGTSGRQKLVEASNLLINKQGVEAELYRLRERISQVYFSILLTDQTSAILKVNRDDLEARLKKVESGIKNGSVLPLNTPILKAEIIKVEQKQIENNSQRLSVIAVLSVLTGTELPPNASFTEPQIVFDTGTYSNLRPEYKLFDLQEQRADALIKLTSTRDNPRFYAFGNLGYGRPGLNMFKEDAALYYIVGAKLSWNIWNWKQTKREIEMLDLSKSMLENQKKAFDLNTKASANQYLAEIEKLKELLKTDETLITYRVEITKAMASQLENGIITATEYVTEYNAEIQSRLTKSLHLLQLLQAKTGYLAVTGRL